MPPPVMQSAPSGLPRLRQQLRQRLRGCVGGLVVWLACSAAAWGQAAAEKPVLVLDAGGHTARVRKVLFTPDGRELISVSDDKTIRRWDTATGQPLGVLRPPIGAGPQGKLHAAALSPDGKILAVGGYPVTSDPVAAGRRQQVPIYLISLPAGRLERKLSGHTNTILALAFSSDGRLASGSADHTARIWNVASGNCERTLTGHGDDVYDASFSPDGQQLATASYDQTARLWSVTGSKGPVILRHEKPVRCVSWSPDGRSVATGSKDPTIRLWNTDGTRRGQWERPNGSEINSLVFTRDSNALLLTQGGANGDDYSCVLFDLGRGRSTVQFTRHTNTVLNGALSPDGALAATGDSLGEIYLWKTDDGALVHRLAGKGRTWWSGGWSLDGERIAWGTSDASLERSFDLLRLEFGEDPDGDYHRARLSRGSLELERAGERTVSAKRFGRRIATLELTKDHDGIRCFSLLNDDRAAIGAEWGLYLYDAVRGKKIREFLGHTGTVLAVSPSPDGRYLLSASNDQTLRVWDPNRDAPLLSLFFAGDEWIAWTPEGYYACSAGGERLMGWHVGNGHDQMASYHPAAQFRKTLYRPDVISRLLETGGVERALELAGEQATQVARVLPPKVRITLPARTPVEVAQPELQVAAVARSVSGHPIKRMRLLLDGRPYQGAKGLTIVPERVGMVVAETWTVMLEPGTHRLAVQAETEASTGLSDEVEVSYTAPREIALPTLYVLAIGISAYPPPFRLNYAAKDARDFADAVETCSAPLFKEVAVKLLTDKDATQEAVLEGMEWFRREMTQNDVGIIYYSGHGVKDDHGDFYWAAVDSKPDKLFSTGVPASALKTAVAGTPGRVVLLTDCCHAGALGGDRRKTAERRKSPDTLTDDLVRDLVTDDYGAYVMCSSMGREPSIESDVHKQGYFTLALLEGLKGRADAGRRDGIIYIDELDTYVAHRVKELTDGRQHPTSARPTSIRTFPLTKP